MAVGPCLLVPAVASASVHARAHNPRHPAHQQASKEVHVPKGGASRRRPGRLHRVRSLRHRHVPAPPIGGEAGPPQIAAVPLDLPPPPPPSPWGPPLPDARLGAVDAAPDPATRRARDLAGPLHDQAQPDSQSVQLAPVPPPMLQAPTPGVPR